MSSYHCSVSTISRGQGQSACAAAAYQSGERIVAERTGAVCQYGRTERIDHTEILLPDGAPDRWRDRSVLWNEVEATEKRKDSRLGRKLNIALPRELSLEENIGLVRGYVNTNFLPLGMVADIAIHNDEGNPHAHIMLTDRTIDFEANGFGKKDPAWNKTEMLVSWREGWADAQNTALAYVYDRENVPDQEREYVSAKSYEEQGIDKEATRHEGYAVRAIESREMERCEHEGRDYTPVTRIGRENAAIHERNSLREQISQQIERLQEKARELYHTVTHKVDKVIDLVQKCDNLRNDAENLQPKIDENQAKYERLLNDDRVGVTLQSWLNESGPLRQDIKYYEGQIEANGRALASANQQKQNYENQNFFRRFSDRKDIASLDRRIESLREEGQTLAVKKETVEREHDELPKQERFRDLQNDIDNVNAREGFREEVRRLEGKKRSIDNDLTQKVDKLWRSFDKLTPTEQEHVNERLKDSDFFKAIKELRVEQLNAPERVQDLGHDYERGMGR